MEPIAFGTQIGAPFSVATLLLLMVVHYYSVNDNAQTHVIILTNCYPAVAAAAVKLHLFSTSFYSTF